MRTLSIPTLMKTSIFSVGCFLLVLTGIDLFENFQHKEYMEKTCSNPAANCPLDDPWSILPLGIPGLVLTMFGIYFIISGQTQKK